MPRANYMYTVNGPVVAVVDLDQGSKSRSAGAVTNDIENVLDDIRAELCDLAGYLTGGPAVIYRDSMGRWDGVRQERGLAKLGSFTESYIIRHLAELLSAPAFRFNETNQV